MEAIFRPSNSSRRGEWEEEEKRKSEQGEEGEEKSDQQTIRSSKRRPTQLRSDQLNCDSSHDSAVVNSPGVVHLQAQGHLCYKWSPCERIYVSGRGQETSFGVVPHVPPGNSGRRIW